MAFFCSGSGSVAFVPLASFLCQARGIKLYDAPISMVLPGVSLGVELESSNLYDANCISLSLLPNGLKLGHLAREAAAHLAPLLRCGCQATGRVFSTPYSRAGTSRAYGHRVCDVQVTVAGPTHLLHKVQVALGRLQQFTVLTNTDKSYDGDDESDVSNESDISNADNSDHITTTDKSTLLLNTDNDTDYNLSDDTVLYVPETDLSHDSDSTRLDSDCVITDITRLNTDTDITRLDTDATTDTTPLLIRPDRQSSPLHMPLTKRLKRTATASHHKDNDTSTDTTPLLIQTATRKRKQRPKRLFTTTNK